MQIERQWALLKSLPDHRNPKSTEEIWRIVKTDMHDVSKRTVERDLECLASLFPIGQRAEGRTNYWFWESGVKMWIPGITDDEALTLYMAERNLNMLLPEGSMEKLGPYFSVARERLESQPKSIRPWTKKFRLIPVGPNRRPASIYPEALRTVRDALLRDKQVTLSLRHPVEGQASTLLVNPLSLIQQGNDLQLVFTRAGEQSIEHVRLQHIGSAAISLSSFDGPTEFDPDAYLQTGALTARPDLPIPVGDWIEFSGVFSEEIGDLLNETPWVRHFWCMPEEDGRLRIKAMVRFTSDFVDWLLSLGPDVCVSQPASLRRHIAQRLTQAAAHYAGEDGNEVPQRTKRWLEDWKSVRLTCEKCQWQGSVKKASVEPSDNASSSTGEFRCPKCSHLLLNVEHAASLDEMMANWNTLNDATKGAILSRPERMELIERDKLKSPSDLPDLKSGPNFLTFKLTWHPDPEVSYSIWHGISLVWIQLANWEGHAEFLRIAEIIRERYSFITDLKPTPEAKGFLIGNDPTGQQNIERARKLFSSRKDRGAR
jgi:predicted DNA-binding transcriptional regulator YafY